MKFSLPSVINDPIIYLNVEGEGFCILRSTPQENIPESQLTLRLSFRKMDRTKGES
jgi:hypothetical protein